MLASQVFEDRRCHGCSSQEKFGCYKPTKSKVYFEGEFLDRCPLIHMRDNMAFYSEIFSLYSAREKGLFAEPGSYFDQPNAYNDLMSIVDIAISDSFKEKQSREEWVKKEQEKLNKSMGIY